MNLENIKNQLEIVSNENGDGPFTKEEAMNFLDGLFKLE